MLFGVSRLPDELIQHLREPRHVGRPEGEPLLRGEASNPACRDLLVLFLVPADDGTVARAGFQATGCPACLAMAAVAAEHAHGLKLDAGLPDALVSAHHAAFGEPAGLHRHALKLVTEAAAQAVIAIG